MVKRNNEFTKTYHWFFCDIVSSADPLVPTREQLEKIQKFYEILSKISIVSSKDPNRIIVPAGDGYVIGFSDSPEKPILLAKNLLQKIEKYNKTKRGKSKIFLRVGIESGPVYVIEDLLTKQNAFWGPGIIMAKRVMDLGKENHILASKRIAEDLTKLSREYKSLFHSIGKYEIKHGETIEIFNVYGKDFGNKIFPRKDKKIKKQESDAERQGTSNFRFKKVNIILEVVDPKSMMTHHTWIWDLVNISKTPQPQILYQIGGETKRDFSELNVKVKDNDEKNLDIVRIDKNTPLYKEFFVKLTKPVKVNRQVKGIKLEYDWEETEREFVFEPPTECKEFNFKLVVPNEIKPRGRVFKRIGISEKQPLDASTKHGKEKSEISWAGKNLKPFYEYIIQW